MKNGKFFQYESNGEFLRERERKESERKRCSNDNVLRRRLKGKKRKIGKSEVRRMSERERENDDGKILECGSGCETENR